MQLETTAGAMARFGHALSDPTRARILTGLADGARYPSELAEDLNVSRPSLSNHLACLRGCGLVVATAEGRRVRYELADSRIKDALDHIRALVLIADPDCQMTPRRHEEPSPA